MRVEFHGLRLDLPAGWLDVTDELADGAPPSLARADGGGALQFTIARFAGGEDPVVDAEALRGMLDDLLSRHRVSVHDRRTGFGALTWVQGRGVWDGGLVLARYMSNESDIVLATYVATEARGCTDQGEVEEVGGILDSISLS